MRRLAAMLDVPTGENSSDAAQLTTDLWIGGRSAAMDVLAANSRGITDLVNICEPWCPLGPNSENIQYVGIEAEDRASFPILLDKHYGKIRSHVCAGRTRGAVFLIHSDVGANRSAAIAAALLLDDGINLIEVVRLLKERRPQCLTNKGFRLELVRKARRMNRLGPDAEIPIVGRVLQGNRINTEDPDYEPPRRRAGTGIRLTAPLRTSMSDFPKAPLSAPGKNASARSTKHLEPLERPAVRAAVGIGLALLPLAVEERIFVHESIRPGPAHVVQQREHEQPMRVGERARAAPSQFRTHLVHQRVMIKPQRVRVVARRFVRRRGRQVIDHIVDAAAPAAPLPVNDVGVVLPHKNIAPLEVAVD